MPDRYLPKRWRWALRVTRGLFYLAILGGVTAGLVHVPQTISSVLGTPLTLWWSLLIAVGTGVALVGVLTDRYRVEWIALWPAIGGATIYASTVWYLALLGEMGRVTQAGIVSGVTFALIHRALELAAHAAKLRAEHLDTGPTLIVDPEPVGDTDGV